ncbi:MAG: arginine--tRNA ligase [Lachnospiraceae bacterium]|nr:arginine--tRNA ligase [Lachnospiraceae bacterium]
MEKLLDRISREMQDAFEKAGYNRELGRVSISNRPDLCEYQCNGAMAGAKQYHCAPIQIAQKVAEQCASSEAFEKVEAVAPGFLNITLKGEFLKDYVVSMKNSPKFGLEKPEKTEKIIIDYGGPNVAKPLHVGHLRSAIIGQSLKRILRYAGHEVIGDIHMGDWGLQMGLIIHEFGIRHPESVYLDESYTGEYPAEPPFTLAELEEIYPFASGKSKEDPSYKEKAMEATAKLQNGVRGYRALWHHILNVSVADLKRNYDNLNVDFERWNGESTVHDVIPGMVEDMKKGGYAYISEGALVVDVKEETDTKEVPPCMILKSDGASLYNTTDLATIKVRNEEDHPDEIIYVVDKRQELYFTQVFRCARKTRLVEDSTKLRFLGFGTMNGADGKPFKTRSGGVMRLEYLIQDIYEEMYRKISENKTDDQEMPAQEAEQTARKIAMSAIIYGDLSNQASKDYIFDIDRFTSFEGDTGPYLLYTMVRIKSILNKAKGAGISLEDLTLQSAYGSADKDLMKQIASFGACMESAVEELAPHKICAFLYDLANTFNHFYHETKILTEENTEKRDSYLALLQITLAVMEDMVALLGFEAPERM